MGWERKRGKLHELNRLLRGAHGHDLPAAGAAGAAGAPGHPLRDHARRRHPAAAGGRAPAGRDDGAPAEPARLRSREPGASSKGTRCSSRASTPTLPETGGARSSSSIFSGPRGIDPYAFAVSDVYQDLFGEGSTPARASTTSTPSSARSPAGAGEHAALPRPLRGPLRARRARLRRRALRGLPGPLRGGGRRASTAGCAATGSCCPGSPAGPGSAASRDSAHRPLEDAGQPAAQPLGARRPSRTLLARLVPAGRRRAALDALRARRPLPSALLSFFSNLFPSAAGSPSAATCAASRADLALGARAGGAAARRSSRTRRGYDCDAIARTLWRLAVTRRQLLEWVTGRAGAPRPGSGAAGFYRRMRRRGRAGGRGRRPASSCGLGARWPCAAPFVAALARCRRSLAWWISLPPRGPAGERRLSGARRGSSGAIARRTWRFFERFVGPRRMTCRPTTSRKTRSPRSRTAPRRPTSGSALLSTVAGPRLRLDRHRATWSSVSRRRLRPRSDAWSASAATSTTGTTRATCGRSSPATSRRSTAATSPAHLIDARAGLPRASWTRPASVGRALDGVARHAGPAAEIRVRRSRTAPRPRRRRPAARGGRCARRRALLVDRARRRSEPSGPRAWPPLAAPRRDAGRHRRARFGQEDDGAPDWRSAGSRGRMAPAGLRREPCARRRRRWRTREDPAEASRRPSRGDRRRRRGAPGGGDGLHASSSTGRASCSRSAIASPRATLDSGYYDLLASEARLASFVAIARGDVPVEHWFHLGRPLTPSAAARPWSPGRARCSST